MSRAIACCLVLLAAGPVSARGQTPAGGAPHQHAPAPPPAPPPAGHEHPDDQAPPPPLPPFIPTLTDADRAAAFPDVMGHSVHDDGVNYFLLFDQVEWQTGRDGRGLNWDNRGWIGKDRRRFWFRTEGHTEAGRIEQAQIHALYGRAVSRWWDVVAGLRQDVGSHPGQTWAAIGDRAWRRTGSKSRPPPTSRRPDGPRCASGRNTSSLVTNRLIAQPNLEIDLEGRSDRARAIGAGLSSAEAGLRLRYEVRREVAPYLGVSWHRRFFGTGDAVRAAGGAAGGARLTLGLRLWR
ncbi:MAG: copper resistance protein B [Vicinamibacterales bacterium]